MFRYELKKAAWDNFFPCQFLDCVRAIIDYVWLVFQFVIKSQNFRYKHLNHKHFYESENK